MRRAAVILYWAATLAAFCGAVVRVFAYTPDEATMGVVQKIFYFHMPIAISTFLACLVCFAGSIGYLAQRRTWWDDLASAAAATSVLLCTGVLLTGMLWGRAAWGVWWTWSPRLTFSFMLWLLYVVYLMVRSAVESPQRRAVIAAVYGIVAFLDVPLVWLSARMLPDIHPGNIGLTGEMRLTLGICFVPLLMLAAGLLAMRYRLYRLRRGETAEAGFPVILAGETP